MIPAGSDSQSVASESESGLVQQLLSKPFSVHSPSDSKQRACPSTEQASTCPDLQSVSKAAEPTQQGLAPSSRCRWSALLVKDSKS